MRFDIVTIFPEAFPGPLALGVMGRALERGLASVHAHDLRAFADMPHRQVDDEPFGGGAGMVFKPEPLCRALENVAERVTPDPGAGPRILLTPQGTPFRQARAQALAEHRQITLVCGRYEGIDERIRDHLIDDEISIGDFVVTGGELPAMLLVEAVTRLLPDALGDPDSARNDSFSDGLLDYPQYTRPASYRGWQVPEVLRSGNHAAIATWRRQQALERTRQRRPDLLSDDGESRG